MKHWQQRQTIDDLELDEMGGFELRECESCGIETDGCVRVFTDDEDRRGVWVCGYCATKASQRRND